MGGGMEANKNRWIEDWGTARENLEHNFRWTRRNLALVGIFGVAVPILVYKGIVKDFAAQQERKEACSAVEEREREKPIMHMQDEDAGRPYRKFWFT